MERLELLKHLVDICTSHACVQYSTYIPFVSMVKNAGREMKIVRRAAVVLVFIYSAFKLLQVSILVIVYSRMTAASGVIIYSLKLKFL